MKTGEYGWITDHMSGMCLEPVKVKVLAVNCTGIRSVKVITESGSVLYCKPDQIKSRPGKALKAEPAIPAAVKATAERIADQKIRDFKGKKEEEKHMTIITEAQAAERKERKNKTTFEEVAKAFVSLAKASDLEDEHPELSLVVNLATEQLRTKYAGGWE